jgi:hypothetical protein
MDVANDDGRKSIDVLRLLLLSLLLLPLMPVSGLRLSSFHEVLDSPLLWLLLGLRPPVRVRFFPLMD